MQPARSAIITSTLFTAALTVALIATPATADASYSAAPGSQHVAHDGRHELRPHRTRTFETRLTAEATYDQLVDVFRDLETAMPEMEMTFYGTSAAGRALPLLVLNEDRQFTSKRLRRTGRPLILVTAGVHGDEAAGSFAVETLVHALGSDDARLLGRANFLLVPALDVDGLASDLQAARHRTLAGLDLDRDWLKVQSREIYSLLSIVRTWKPDLVIDLHADCDQDPAKDVAAAGSEATVRIRRIDDLPSAIEDWLERLRPTHGISAAHFGAGSAAGYFALRRRPLLRLDGDSRDPVGLATALLDVLDTATGDPETLHRAVAAWDATRPAVEGVGYVVKPGWTVIEDTLRAHGIEGRRVVAATKGSASILRLHGVRFDSAPTEGQVRLHAEAVAEPAVRVLDTGSLWIPADQPLFDLARELLEPTAAESLASWGLLSSQLSADGSVAPVLRLHGPPSEKHLQPWH